MPRSLDETLNAMGLSLIEKAVGVGGSASVHKCRVEHAADHLPTVGTPLAVKEFKPDILTVPNALARIRQEADVGARVRHPNLVRTYGLAGGEGDDPALLILEWVDGERLDIWLEAQPRDTPWEVRRAIALGLVEAVDALHQSDVLHRDIKPENVMLRQDGVAVLMDVGVAELTGNDEHTLHTSVREFVGSVRFAAPQFLRGEPFTAAEDVYSLTATLFSLFTGKQLYAEIDRKPLIPWAVLSSPVRRVEGLLPGVPVPLRVLLEGGLNHNANRRPSLAEMRESLTNPEVAPYISKELEAQAAEVRSCLVVSVLKDGGSFFADLRGNEPRIDEDYTVVRPHSSPVRVPSLNRDVIPEMFIADAVLKHVYQGLGHFAISRRRWVEAPAQSVLGLAAPGHWVNEEGSKVKVAPGDLVVRSRDSDGYVL